MRFLSALALLFFACGVFASLTADPTPVAANLVGVADWQRTLPFVDVVKQARPFGSPQKPWDGSCPVDSNGWPTQDFGVTLMDDILHLSGTYLLHGYFRSRPTISGVASASSTITITSYDSSSGELYANIVVQTDDQSPNQLMLAFTGTNGGGRNLSVILPGYTLSDATSFTTKWKSLLSKFVLFRYMDWASTNGNPVVSWSDRNVPSYASWAYGAKGSTGVPWEICIKLANEVGRDMWINVPAHANDDYVYQLAMLFKQQLNPGLNLYIEYSNEVWNWQFEQATYNLNAAVAEVNSGDANRLNYDNSNNKYYWGYRRVALRLKQIIDTFSQVWGSSAINTRVRGVLAGQVVQPVIAQLGLDYIDAVFGDPKKWFYAIAGAPYFNLGNLNNNPSMTVDQVLQAFQQSVNGMSPAIGVGSDNPLAGNAALARWYGLQMRGYEGGPDTFGPNGIQAKAQATMDPRMKAICINYLNNWVSYGFAPLNWFSAGASDYNGQYGTWALTNDMDNFNVPKIQAIDAVRTSPPAPLAIGTAIPGTVNATQYVGHNVPISSPYLQYLNAGDTFDYIVRANANGQYSIRVWTSGTNSGAVLQILANKDNSASVTVPNTGDWNTFQPTPSASLPLTQGVNVLRLKVVTNRGYNIQQIQIS